MGGGGGGGGGGGDPMKKECVSKSPSRFFFCEQNHEASRGATPYRGQP